MPDRLETSQLVEPDSMVIDNPPPSHDGPAQLSAQLLQTSAANRQVERDLRKKMVTSFPEKLRQLVRHSMRSAAAS